MEHPEAMDVDVNTEAKDTNIEEEHPGMLDDNEDNKDNAVQKSAQDGPKTQPVRSILRKSHSAAEGDAAASRPEPRPVESGIADKEGEKTVKFDPGELEKHEIEAATRMLNRELEGAKLASDDAKTPWPWQVDNPDFDQIPPLDLSPRSSSAISPASSRKSSISGSSIVQPGSPGSRRSSSSSGKRVLLDLPTEQHGDSENYDENETSAKSDRFNKLRKEHYAMTGRAMRNALRKNDQDSAMSDSAIESSDELMDNDVVPNNTSVSNGLSPSRGKRVLLNLPDDAGQKEGETSAGSNEFNDLRKKHYSMVGAAMRKSLGKDDSSDGESGSEDSEDNEAQDSQSVPPVPQFPNGKLDAEHGSHHPS